MINILNKKSGIALISVLITIAILTPISIKLMSNYWKLLNKTTMGEGYNSALMYTMFAEDFARYALHNDKNQFDHNQEKWTEKINAIPVDGGVLSGYLEELQGRLNVNNLYIKKNANADDKLFYQNSKKSLLILLTQIGLSKDKANSIINAIIDWLDADSNVTYPGGAEDIFYESFDKPYRTANNLMTHISELLLIKGMTFEIFTKIQGCLVALPTNKSKININTANTLVSNAFKNTLKLTKNSSNTNNNKKHSCNDKGTQNYKTIDSFFKKINNENLTAKQKLAAKNFLSVRSNYFVAKITASFQKNKVKLQTYLQRNNTSGTKNNIKVLFRSFGDSIIPNNSTTLKTLKTPQ